MNALRRVSDRVARVVRHVQNASPTTKPDGSDRRAFLSFRRDDTEYLAVQLYHDLSTLEGQENGPVDYLVDPFEWMGPLIDTARDSTLVLVLIGPKWLDILIERHTSDGGFSDPVHIELLTALRHQVPLLAVLVGDASLPTASSLPPELSQLADIPSMRLRTSSWRQDVDALEEAIEHYRRT